MNQETEQIDQLEKRMRRAGAFHPDDLVFNQLGELSQRQKRWLMVEIVGWSVQIAISLALTFYIWMFYYLGFQYDGKQVWWLGGLFWSFVFGINILVLIGNMRPIWADITNNEVLSIAGPISKNESWTTIRGKGNARNWSLQIRDKQFSILPFAYASLIEHQNYRVFYTPILRRVINIEPIFDLDTE